MSEAESEGDGEQRPGRQEIWIEKYRPQTLDEVAGHDDITARLGSYIERNDLPNLLFSGPAGVGKCVTGETPVLTNRGVERMDTVVGDTQGFSEPAEGLEVLTFDERDGFEYTEPSHVFGKRTDELIEVETRDGEEISVTPEHRLFALTPEGLEWKRAENLQQGDRIARPLRIPSPDGNGELDWRHEMDGDRTLVHVTEEFATEYEIPAEENWVGTKKQVFRQLRNGAGVEETVASLGVPEKTVQDYRREADDIDLDATETVCSLSFLRELDCSRLELQRHVQQIQYVTRYNKRSQPVTPPWSVTPQLAKLVGFAVSEARIDNGRIKFYNTDERLLREFTQAASEVFDIEVEEGTQRDVPYREINSRTVTHLLESCFDVFNGTSGGDGIGSSILGADEETRAAFLGAVFDAEARVTKNGIIELTQKNEHLITLLSYLLAGFGIPSRRKTREKKATNGSATQREYHTLYISGGQNLAQFEKTIGFDIDEKASRLADGAARDSSPNNDTMGVQNAVDDLCEDLYLEKSALLTDTLNPESPGRENYLEDIDEVLDAASKKLETAQRALERLDDVAPKVENVTGTPAAWLGDRSRLGPLETRKKIEAAVDIRSDYLLEYADGRRTPTGERTGQLLKELDSTESKPPVETVQAELTDVIEELNVPYERIADRTELRGTDIINLLENRDHDLSSLCRFATVTDRVRDVASGMLSQSVLEAVRVLDTIANANLYYDAVKSVGTVAEERRVYDLTVPETRNYVAGPVPTVMHNTTSATAIAKELYGDDWEQNFLELNASDQRGIDVVRDRIKNFARSSFGGYDYRIIFLDEADSLCVPPGTEVVTGYPSSPEIKPIEEVDEGGEPIPSVDFGTNEIQSDTGKLVDSGVADFFELELEDGRTVLASPTHPFFVIGADGRLVEKELRELTPGDEIADFKDDVGVSRCEICESWTSGRFCSIDCKNEGHSRELRGRGNPMYGAEWSDERREKIVEKISDGRFKGENNPNYGGDFHGTHIWEMDEATVERFRETFSEMRSGTPWDEWVVDADPEAVKESIAEASAEWWSSLDEDERARLIKKSTENCDYPVCDITGDNNPMRDPEVVQKVSETLEGHEPTGGNIRFSDELGHLVRSDWEYDVAKALQDAGIEYEYEPAFELSDSVFHPDFLIGDTVIEVKGVAKLWGQTEKVEEFLETYGDDYTFVVVGDGELPHHEHYPKGEFDPAFVADGGRRAVQTAEIRRIEYSHRGKAYNISMEDTPNFMLANGILTHNTSDAQSALRRTMEQFSSNTRFILSCNYSSKIIDPIQSRCATFRFGPLGEDAIAGQVRKVADSEGIETTDDGVDALVYAADGDMRKAINALQAAAVMGETVDEDAVFSVTSTARPEEIEEMVRRALDGDFAKARSILDDLLANKGMAGGDIIDQLHRSVWEFDLDDEAAVRLMDRVGEVDYRITEGANERVQLEALLASLSLEDE